MPSTRGRSAAIAVLVALSCATVLAEQQERSLLRRKVLSEVVLADFSQAGAAKLAKTLHPQVTVKVEAGELTAVFPARTDGAAVTICSLPGIDVSKMDLLRFDIKHGGKSRISATLTVLDDPAAKGAAFELSLDPGPNVFAIPLWHVQREGSDQKLNLAAVKELRVTTKRFAEPITLSLAKLAAQKVFEDSSKLRLFRFGDGTGFAGATPVTSKTLYEKERGFGLTGAELSSRTWQDEFPLLGTVVNGKDLEFKVALPDGEYEAQLVAFGVTWQGVRSVSYKVLANGKPVVDEQISKEKFYSFDVQYYGANLFYDPSQTLFDQYHRKYFEAHRFDVQAQDGAVTLKFENCGPRALWIYPKASAEDGRALVEGCYAEEGHNLWARHARVRAHAPNKNAVPSTDADQKRGCRVFAREYQYRVYPSDEPSKEDLIPETGLNVTCAPGEFEPLTLTVRPLKDLGLTKIDLQFADPQTPVKTEKFFVKCVPLQVDKIWYEPVPTMLYPYVDRELKKDWNLQYWVTLYVPPGTPAGVYKGAISIEPKDGEKLSVPVAVTVYPFDLPKTKTECGMWNNTAFGSHQLGNFPDNDALAEKVLEAECRNMAEHGLNGYALGAPVAEKYDAENLKVKLDFSTWEKLAGAVKKCGMPGRHKFSILGMADYGIMRKTPYKEFSPEFNTMYKQIMADCRDFLKKHELRAVLQVVDEPRERELNAWNRNRRDTVRHLKLAREVEGLQTMVTPMGDKDSFNRPYTCMVPLMDVVATHSWPQSTDTVYLAGEEKLADLWTYNNGFTRFAHGFYLWKSKALAHWQWVHSWEVCNAHIPVFFGRDTSAAYAFPGGFLNTLKFENIREGIDDHRYLELLRDTLAAANKDNAAAKDAQNFLKVLDKFLPQWPHNPDMVTGAEAGGVYDDSKETTYFGPWRAQLAEYIAAIKTGRAAQNIDAAWAMFPKQLTAEQRTVICKLVDKGPKIDGKGSDPIWKDAPEVSDFVNLAQGVRAPIQTHAKTVCDGERIYFFFKCLEPKYGELKAYAIDRDGDCWMDDSVEAFMDCKFDKKTYKHLIINCLGTVQDEDTRDMLWNGDVQVAVSKEKGAWSVEFSVSLKSLDVEAPKDGTKWGINLCRNRQPAPPETTSWAFVGHSFHNPAGFGTMEFKK